MFILSVFLIIISIKEFRIMFNKKEIYLHKFLPEIISILMAFIFCDTTHKNLHNFVTPIIVLGIILSFGLTIIKNKKPYIMTSLITILSFLFVFLGLYVIKIDYQFGYENYWPIIYIYFSAVLLGDFLASKIGPKFKKKLAPEISPNKTIGGAIVNLISTCIVCMSLNFFISFSILKCILLGITISTFAQFGDLTISSIKRDMELKHSGTIFLEYGGILDRLDAFIFSAPATYYFLCAFS